MNNYSAALCSLLPLGKLCSVTVHSRNCSCCKQTILNASDDQLATVTAGLKLNVE